jgi:hypothetical protein
MSTSVGSGPPAEFALVYMIIYHALALYKSGSDVSGWLRTPSLEMIVSMTASSDSLRKLRSHISAFNAIQASLYLI